MKSYEQMTESVFQKINEYNEAKKESAQRRRKAVGITAAAFVFVCAATLGTVAYKTYKAKTPEPIKSEISVSVPTPTNNNIIAEEAASRETSTEEAIETTTEKVTEITTVLSEPLTRSQEVLNSENYILSKKIHDNTANAEERQLYEEKQRNDEKLYSCVTINDNFADDKVMITYKKSASIVNKIHTADEFPGIEIESIKDLTYIEGSVDSKEALNKEEFHQIIMITLKNKGKEEVLNAISLLENRDDIQYVGPDYHIALADTSKKNTSGLF